MKKRLFCAVLAASACIGGMTAVHAESVPVYTLAPITVTAQRYEKKDVNIAASTQVVTHEELVQTGQQNVQQALSYLDGITYSGMGPNGTAVSSMTSKIVIRGVEDGTLVMVNGTPINWRSVTIWKISPLNRLKESKSSAGAVPFFTEARQPAASLILLQRRKCQTVYPSVLAIMASRIMPYLPTPEISPLPTTITNGVM